MNFDLKNVIEALRSSTEEQALAIVKEIRANDTPQQGISSLETPSAAILRANISDQSLSGTDLTSPRLLTDLDFGQARHPDAGLDLGIRSSTAISTDEDVLSPQTGRYSPRAQNSHGVVEILPISEWTPVAGGDKQFSELLMLLWTWDTTFIRIVDREVFEAGIS